MLKVVELRNLDNIALDVFADNRQQVVTITVLIVVQYDRVLQSVAFHLVFY